MTVRPHTEEQTRIAPPAPPPKVEAEEPPRGAMTAAEERDCRELLGNSHPGLRRRAEQLLRAAGKLSPADPDPPAVEESPPDPTPPPDPPTRKAGPSSAPLAREQLPPPSAPDDRAWAVLMTRSLEPEPERPDPRREVGGPRSGLVVAHRLVEAYAADASQAALSALLDCLAAFNRDWKPETRAFLASAIAEVHTGRLGAEELKGLISDAAQKGVKARARKLSHDLREVLAARRTGRRVPRVKSPAAGHCPSGARALNPPKDQEPSPTGHHYTTSRSARP